MAVKKQKKRRKPKLSNRILAFMLSVSVAFTVLCGRLIYVQFVWGGELKEMALEQQTKEKEINPRRGTIYDTNGKELAISANVDTVAVDPKLIREQKNGEFVATILADVLEMDKGDILKILEKSSRFEYVKKRIDIEQSQILRRYISGKKENGEAMSKEEKKQFNMSGVSLVADTKRYYPYGTLAAQVIGMTGADNQGLEGLELKYDKYLKGTAGKLVKSEAAAGSPAFDYEKYYNAQAGSNIVLTIDESIQRIVEKCLDEAAIENKVAKGASVVVMNPNSGEILAMASAPTYNLNEPIQITDPEILAKLNNLEGDEYSKLYVETTSEIKRNKPVVDVYEPGSTFKLITCAMALEEGASTLEQTYNCAGYLTVAGRPIHCWKTAGHGTQTFMKGMVNSCNPVLMQVGAKIGRENFIKNFKMFGFREPTGIDFPGEAIGSFHAEDKFKEVDLMVSSFGQSFEVTPLQMVTAISSLVNGGTLYKPYLVREIQNPDGQVTESIGPQKIRQTVSAETSEKMRKVMETVVVESGSTAAVKGYRIGGKSGTSEKQPRGSGKYIGSFVGVAPIDDPKIICMVILDEPQGENYYGGVISGPVAGRIMEEIMQYYGIEPQYSEAEMKEMDTTVPDVTAMDVDSAKRALEGFLLQGSVRGSGAQVLSQEPAAGSKLKNGSTVILYTGAEGDAPVVKLPNVIGKSVEEANKIITDAKLTIKITGNSGLTEKGTVTKQEPEAGTVVSEGAAVAIFVDGAGGE